jgi:LacI family transcriptional regulator
MRDVAALAGVSIKTVSRVVNREPGVKESVRTTVLAAAERLDYRHNLAASNLRRTTARTLIVGVLVQDVSNSYSAALVRALEDMARSRHTAVLTSSLDEDADREQELVRSLVERRVDGLILVPTTERQDYLAAEQRAGLPLVFVDRLPTGIDADSVTIDNHGGARRATEHLLDHGHRRIAVLLDLLRIPTAGQRLAGVRDGHAARGLRLDPELLVHSVRTTEEAADVTRRLLALPDPPTAIFAGRNALTAGVVQALTSLGLRRSVALVGFDDFPLAELLDPPLTVVRQDLPEIGARAAALLFDRIDGVDVPPRHVVLAPTLVERGSGEIPGPFA